MFTNIIKENFKCKKEKLEKNSVIILGKVKVENAVLTIHLWVFMGLIARN